MDALKDTFTKYSKVIVAALVLVGLMVAYNLFYLQPRQADNGNFIRSENQSITSSEIGREIVSTLNRLKTINIDPDFFTENRFRRLIDFSVEIQPQSIGKDNPFKEVDLFETVIPDEETPGGEDGGEEGEVLE